MKKYAVGDVVSIQVKIMEVHPQGYASGVEVHGIGASQVVRPKNPLEKETPDTVIGEFLGVVNVDAAKRIHFSADYAVEKESSAVVALQ